MIFQKILQPVFKQVIERVMETDDSVNNLEMENGFNLLQENGDLINLE
jgi:hypothetical protein